MESIPRLRSFSRLSSTTVFTRRRMLPVLSLCLAVLVGVPWAIARPAPHPRLEDGSAARLKAPDGSERAPLDAATLTALLGDLEDEGDGDGDGGLPPVGLSPWSNAARVSASPADLPSLTAIRDLGSPATPHLCMRC